jgi:hypothetical protein
MPQMLVLRRPRKDEEDEFIRAHHATTPEVPYFLHYYEEGMSLSRYLEVGKTVSGITVALPCQPCCPNDENSLGKFQNVRGDSSDERPVPRKGSYRA